MEGATEAIENREGPDRASINLVLYRVLLKIIPAVMSGPSFMNHGYSAPAPLRMYNLSLSRVRLRSVFKLGGFPGFPAEAPGRNQRTYVMLAYDGDFSEFAEQQGTRRLSLLADSSFPQGGNTFARIRKRTKYHRYSVSAVSGPKAGR